MTTNKTVAKGIRDLEDLDAVFEALAHRSRRTILSILLIRGGAMTSRDIADRFSCAWATTSRHLGVLKNAGLVSVELDGREHIYRLNRDRLVTVAGGWIDRFRS
ncbi:ArsR/SmtB family transcription factor [Sulfobacillus harzensis]|uniref:Helix-turn-helix transcriptional regulator n=1 Tax=Sulfobacillus harzensis TaxID=2729629 RepID=A0A7Y0L1D6_9FIRM|nr:metalloregulator ArsR/SmtB family transcription factor [Sulfobacillus harzensis]NMP21430.1 helix-turn-helix transcriptional regulator [Sulfobacillus harzensis]